MQPLIADQPRSARQYVENFRTLLDRRIVPALRHGILKTATSRPPSLVIEVMDDPSPYDIGAKRAADGALTVRLSVGYLTLHDAALDAVTMAGALNRPRDLQRYLIYQLAWAHASYRNGTPVEAISVPLPFDRFIGLDKQASDALFGRRELRDARVHIEIESLGWTIAYLLVQADPQLVGRSETTIDMGGTGAARLAASSGLFPVPPFATALDVAAIDQSAEGDWNPRVALCRAASLIEGGVEVLRADSVWRARSLQHRDLQRQVLEINTQIEAMRRDGGCPFVPATTS
jgi:hypothetical protein